MKTIYLQLRNLTAIIIALLFTSTLTAQVTLPVNQDFNAWHDASGWNISAGWDVQTTSAWEFETSGESFPTATNGYMSVYISPGFPVLYTITTPEIDLTAVTNGVSLSWYQSLTETTANMETKVEISTDNGTSWTTIRSMSGLITNQEATEDLTTEIGASTSLLVRWSMAYVNGSGVGTKWSLDDISIREITGTDVGVYAITSPVSGCSLSDETVTVNIKNYGTNPVVYGTVVPVQFSVDGGTTWSVLENFTNGVGAGEVESYTFTALADLSSVTTYDFRVRTVLPADEATGNDENSMSVINEQTISSFPYEEDFESGNGSWYSVNGTSISSWESGAPNSTNLTSGANGSANAWASNLTGNHNTGENSYVYSPCFDLATIDNPIIEFDLWYLANNNGYGSYDGMQIEYTLDYGVNWTVIGAVGSGENWYEQPTGWFGQVDWTHAKQELPYLANETSVKFRFAMNTPEIPWSSLSEGYAFDNIKVYDKPAFDVGVSEWVSPEGACGMGSDEMVRIKITNFGTDNVSNIPLELSIDGGATFVKDTLVATINTGETAQHIFYLPAVLSDFSAPSVYNCVVKTTLSTDGNNLNNELSYTVISKPSYDTEITENFDNNYAGYWNTYLEFGSINNWEHGIPMGDTINVAASGTNAWVTNLTGGVSVNQTSYVESPCYDLTNINFACFEFNIALNTYTQGNMAVEYSTDEGLNWSILPGIPATWDQTTWYPNNWPQFGGDFNAGEWQTKVRPFTDIDDLNNNPSSVKFRVKFVQGAQFAAEGVAFDDVRIYSDENLWLNTSIEEETSNNSFEFYPNPAHNYVIVKSETVISETIQVLDITGKVVKQINIQDSEFNIQIDDLENGVYFIKFGNTIKKLIKN